ncbi:DNA-binding transcriptional LysR family regulator [Methylopila capsulata]|uniref:DNA-binding transcriptional LysR family regulator n=1 Tax=Methylopila capsulata TaxID=61654 RepID=A0A9W6ITY0_9HYPH|nr:LysR family transcriptional regulator [Methylopila capsulata]MBM7850856.1 DNA-binding transcriptional LysR family regulator [Methylopila capsulata]GLK56153.1 LysR family transcriptional regulator [Methylopila capsulata]
MDRLESMSVLLAVVEEGSLSGASRRLRSPLATVSRKVAELEKHLGAQLLIRTSRHIQLTDAGRAYVEAARRILEQVEEAERDAGGEYSAPRGELHVTAPIMFGRTHVLPIVTAFLKEQPEIDVRLLLNDRQVSLLEEQVDVAVRIGHLVDSDLRATKVGEMRRVACASPAYLAERGTPAEPKELSAHDGVTFRGFKNAPEWRYRGDPPVWAAEPRRRLAVNSTEAAVAAAVAGLGVVRLLAYQIEPELRSGALVPILEAFAPAPLPVSLVYPEASLKLRKVRAFLDWSAPRLRARL